MDLEEMVHQIVEHMYKIDLDEDIIGLINHHDLDVKPIITDKKISAKKVRNFLLRSKKHTRIPFSVHILALSTDYTWNYIYLDILGVGSVNYQEFKGKLKEKVT